MKVIVGSVNSVKVEAVREILEEQFRDVIIEGKEIISGVSDQPTSIKEVVQGAKNRATGAFQNCDYSIGIESGLIEVPGTLTGYLHVNFSAIFDGNSYSIGCSSGFELPRNVTELIFNEKIGLNEAVCKIGLTSDQQLGKKEGIIGLLTKGNVTRAGWTKEAVKMALVQLVNKPLYT